MYILCPRLAMQLRIDQAQTHLMLKTSLCLAIKWTSEGVVLLCIAHTVDDDNQVAGLCQKL